MKQLRYSWEKMPEDYKASYFNEKDYNDGKKFIIVDNETGKKYIYPQIEIRQDNNGRKYKQITIDHDLCNAGFIGWGISTSKDFIKHVGSEWFTLDVLNYVVEHFEFYEIFDSRLGNYMTKKLWDKAFKRNEKVLRYVPKEYITSEMINSVGHGKKLILINGKYKYVTPETFKKIYFNCDTEKKLELITPVPNNRTDIINNPMEDVGSLITQEVANDILKINIKTICHIPYKFITKEIAYKAMETDPLLIQFIPLEYQTLKYQKMLIDKKAEYLSFIDPSILTDEIIYYALSKKVLVLGKIPKERRTLELCEYAINNSGKALRFVPENIKTADLCFKAVVKYPSAIKYVPVEFLNQEFVDLLDSLGVVIPIKNRGYVDECLIAHKKLNIEEQPLNIEESVLNELKISSDYSDIKLESLSGLFTSASLNLLLQYDVSTVGGLLKVSDNSDFYGMLLNNSKAVYKEISGAIKLLRCKYMDIDPLIEFIDTGDKYSDMKDFSKEIGFSTRAKNALLRGGISPKRLLEIMHNPSEQASLYRLKNAGETAVQEIIEKASIVVNFYDKKEEKKEVATDDESIEMLIEELGQVRTEIQRLNARTNEILAKIKEKKLEKNRGGVLK